MKNYLDTLIERFPIRRNKEQKEEFRNFVKNEVKNYSVECETLEKHHTNIIIGNVKNADVVFTAHYDTPGRSLFPNLMMPKNHWLAVLYGIFISIILAFIALADAYSLTVIFELKQTVTGFLYILIYFGIFYLFTRAYPNKNNSNDNTSGVSVVLSLTENKHDNVAFILFDNEEKGLLGSKAFKKANKELMSKKVLVNLDCVGNGKNIIITGKKKARTTDIYKKLEESFISNEDYNVEYIPMEKARCNTDHRNYDLGIGIVACKNTKKGFCYTPRIHTPFDTEVSFKNIEFITFNLNIFINNL